MRVLYIGMYSDSGLEGLESSSLEKRKDAASSIAKAAGGELLDLMYLQGDYDMAALMELPSLSKLQAVSSKRSTTLVRGKIC